MKFVMIPTATEGEAINLGTPNYVVRVDESRFMALPMDGERVASLDGLYSDGTIYPKLVTTEQLCKWWHRVRQWTVIANHSLWPANQPTALTNSAINEECVMKRTGTSPEWFSTGSWSGSFTYTDPISVVRTVSFVLEILAKPDSVFVLRSYYLTGDFTQLVPYIRLTVSIEGLDGNFAYGDTAGFFDGVPVSSGAIDGSIACEIDAISFTMQAAGAGTGAGSGYGDGPITLQINPSLFWAYANDDDSDPRWNTLTGAKL